MAINFPTSPNVNDTYTFGNTAWRWDGSTWNIISASDVVLTNGFSRVDVSGQSSVSATAPQDVLTFTAGSNITLTTNALSKSVTINSTASGGGGSESNSFSNIAVSGQSTVVAESSTDTLNLVAGNNIQITTDATTDSVTITNTMPAGITSFVNLTDAQTAGLKVSRFYLPAITMLVVTSNGVTAYRFDQYGTSDNPTIYAINGTTIAFDLRASGHPFVIQTGAGNNYNTGLVHVADDGTVSSGASAQGKSSGVLYWKIPTDISGGYRYQCSDHIGMVGSIVVKNFSTV
jgi:plastocyanin